MNGKFALRFLLSLSVVLAACSKKADITLDAIGTPGPAPDAFAHQVDGQSLDGHWVSGCEEDQIQGGFSVYDVTYNGQTYQRTVHRFEDSACTQFSVNPKSTRTGIFRYIAKYNLDIYEVEYRLDLVVEGGSGYESSGENIRRDGNQLWISYRGRGPSVNPMIPLFLVAN